MQSNPPPPTLRGFTTACLYQGRMYIATPKNAKHIWKYIALSFIVRLDEIYDLNQKEEEVPIIMNSIVLCCRSDGKNLHLSQSELVHC